MKYILSLLFIFFVRQTCISQVYEPRTVLETAEQILKESVGESLYPYFKYDKKSYYEYRTKSGKTKWNTLRKKRKTKGNFVSVNVRFILQHPEFAYDWINKTIYISLDKSLNLTGEPNTDFIPDFLKMNEPSNWLSGEQIDNIIQGLNLKKTTYPIVKRLDYDTKSHKYIWTVFNTLYEEDYVSDVEFLEIDPISGKVITHREERQNVVH